MLEMSLFVIFILLIGMSGMVYLSVKTINELEEEKNNAEYRATTFARKIKAVEDLVKLADENKEPYVITIGKVKKELFHDDQSEK